MAASGALTARAAPQPTPVPCVESSIYGSHPWRWAATVAIGLLHATAIGDWLRGPLEVAVCIGSIYAVPAVVAIWITAGVQASQ